MGVVHLAEDVRTGARVAVKVLPAELSRDAELVARLRREAAATAAIAHPNVAHAIELGVDPDGTHWLAMEFVDGRSLREVLAGGALHPARALRIARGVLSALAAAHTAGVIHRDVKPENVMVVATGEGFDDEHVKVLDFGIAKLTAEKHGGDLGTPITAAGTVYGTPHYMAPEQIRREPLDPRVDLYALGAMLFECIAGAPPFDGEDVTVLARHLTHPPPPLTSPLAPQALTLAVRSFVARLMAKTPAARPASAAAAIAELDEAVASIDQAHVEAISLRTGGMSLRPDALPRLPNANTNEKRFPTPALSRAASGLRPVTQAPPSADETQKRGFVQRKTAKLVAFARSYGLQPHQLLLGFAVAIGLILIVLIVAMWS